VRPRPLARAAVRVGVPTVLVFLVLALVAFPTGLMFLRTHPVRFPLDDDPSRHGLTAETVTFSDASDGTRLRGWYFAAERSTGRGVVIAPGIDNNREAGGVTLAIAPSLLAAGFDVLAFDFRAQGESGGDTLTFGAREQGDVAAAASFMRGRGAARVAVLGYSLGAVSALLAAGPAQVDAVIADSAFTDLRTALGRQMGRAYAVPPPLVEYALLLYALTSGTDPATVAPLAAVRAMPPRPLLFIAGADDPVVPVSDSEALAAAAPGGAGLWIVPGSGHTTSYATDPTGYTARVLAFLAEALPPAR
jgi:pimeloyl-ACP methyl ester carboxylesterase